MVEYLERLGVHFKIRNGSRKWLHRRVCENYLPARILKRKKRGFAVNVVDDWFRSSLDGKFQESLLDQGSLMFGLLKPGPVRKLVNDHQSGRKDNHKLLFSLVMFEQWLRRMCVIKPMTGPNFFHRHPERRESILRNLR